MSRPIHRSVEEAYFENDSDGEQSKIELRRTMALRFLEKMRQQGELPEVPAPVLSKDEATIEEDPLDAFMANITKTLEEEKLEQKATEVEEHDSPKSSFWIGGEVCEEEDHTAEYLNDAAIKISEAESNTKSDGDDDDEEEGHSKTLPSVDHSVMAYLPFVKNIYKEHEDITNMPIEERTEFRQTKKISISGYQVPQAISSFGQLQGTIERGLSMNIQHQQWITPTPVQAQSIPVALSGRDLIALASTGSGKTGAYLVPLVQHVCKVLDQWKIAAIPPQGGPVALVVCPTRELALQIYKVTQSLITNLNLRVSCFVGGYDKTQQFKEIVRGIEICICNPGRLIDLATMKGGLQFKDCTFLVLDEADRMLDLGFASDVLSIARSIRPDRQTLMFSATMQSEVERLANEITKRAVRVTIGTEGQASSLVEQRPIVFSDEQRKADWIVDNIHKLARSDRQILVFCNSHGRVLDLAMVINDVLNSPSPANIDNDDDGGREFENQLREEREPAPAVLAPAFARLSRNICDSASSRDDSAHSMSQSHHQSIVGTSTVPTQEKVFARVLFGDMNQGERMEVVSAFRKKKFQILVATDVAARGLDIPTISTVVSYDVPKAGDIHIHRIGRTGRAGVSGVAYTCLTRGDNRMAGFIVESMEAVGQAVPKHVMQLAMSYEPFKTAKLSGRSFTAHMKLKGKKKNEQGLSSVGLGFARGESDRVPAKVTGSFVKSSDPVVISELDGDRPKRRWDSNPKTEQLTIPVSSQANPSTQANLSSQANPSPIHSKRQKGSFSSHVPPSCSTLHIDPNVGSRQNASKVFNPDDDIPSSDEEVKQRVDSTASLLNLQKRTQRTTQNQLAAAQKRAVEAVMASRANNLPAVNSMASTMATNIAVASITDSKRSTRWDPSTTVENDNSLLWGEGESKPRRTTRWQ